MSKRQDYLKLLKNTKVPQTYDFLREGTKYCALGLLCELYRQQTKQGEWNGPIMDTGKFRGRPAFYFKVGEAVCLELPSPEILAWAGLTQTEALVIQKMNDSEKLPFSKIADRLSC